MLTSLSLRNFKCFESADIPLGRITVLIGPNGSGKSSVLHALALLRQSVEQSQIVYSGAIFDGSSFEDVVYLRDKSRDIEISYRADTRINAGDVSYEYDVLFGGEIKRLRLLINSILGQLEFIWSMDGAHPEKIQVGNSTIGLGFDRSIGRHATVAYSPNHTDEDLVKYQEALSLLSAPVHDIVTWRYTTTISRGFSRSTYSLTGDGIDELTLNSDEPDIASGLATAITYDDAMRDQISDWVNAVTGVTIDSKVTRGIRTFVRSRSQIGNTAVTMTNEGSGSGQLIYTLFQLAKTPKGGLDMIEEPELHLHPFAIARLADLLTSEAVKSDKQLLLTTHSEHLLLGLLNNVAEGKLAHTDLVVLSTSLGEDGARVEQVTINQDGLAEGGLPGFFDATLEAQRRHLDALMRRG